MATHKPTVLLKVSDLLLEDTTSEVLDGPCLVVTSMDIAAVDVIVCDVTFAEAASRMHPKAPLVLVNVPDERALVGKTALLEVAAFIPRPASARRVLAAVQQLTAALAA